RSKDEAPAKSGEEKISLFWRVFGGTILSIAALVLLTIYQSLAGNIHDLRTEIGQLKEGKAELAKATDLGALRGEIGQIREAKGDYVKKDEFANSKTLIWNRFQEVQATLAGLSNSATGLKENLTHLDGEIKSFKGERKEMLDGCKADLG